MTPREFAIALEGYRWRDERWWEKCATAIAYLLAPWGEISPKQILDAIKGTPDEARFEQVAGLADPIADLDAALTIQTERRARG